MMPVYWRRVWQAADPYLRLSDRKPFGIKNWYPTSLKSWHAMKGRLSNNLYSSRGKVPVIRDVLPQDVYTHWGSVYLPKASWQIESLWYARYFEYGQKNVVSIVSWSRSRNELLSNRWSAFIRRGYRRSGGIDRPCISYWVWYSPGFLWNRVKTVTEVIGHSLEGFPEGEYSMRLQIERYF